MSVVASEGTWELIPYELLFKIFSHLSVEHLVCSIRHVCFRWMEVSCDARLWRTLVYSPSQEVCSEDVREFLAQAPQLRHFSLGAHGEADRIIEMLPDYCQNVETLNLQCSRHACSSQDLLARVLFCLENIRHLEISLAEIHDELLGSFWLAQNLQSLSLNFEACDGNVHKLLLHVIHSCFSLQELRISFQRDVFDGDLVFLLHKVNKWLTHFSFASGDGFAQTSNIFSQCTNMKSLVINHSWFDRDTFDLKYIGKLPPLESLTILCMSVVPDSLAQLFLDNTWNKLVKLDLVGLKNFDNRSMFHVFRACPNLQELNVSDSSISDEGFHHVCDCSSRLKRVSADGTGLTDAGLQNLHQCCCLAALSVEDCPRLTGDVAHHIAKCARLADINVSNNAWVTGEAVEVLLQCPRLEYLSVEFCAGVTAACLESVAVPQNFRHVKVTCSDKDELENLIEVAARKSFVKISDWCLSLSSCSC